MTKVQLILPPMENFRKTKENGWWQPLGLLSLATYLKKDKPKTEIEIINGDLIGLEKIIKQLDADIIGIKPSIANYNNTLRIAEEAKSKGSFVAFGGHHATHLTEIILKNRKFIDAIIVQDGEEAFSKLVCGENLTEIPNLVYRNKNTIVRNPIKLLDLDSIPFPNYDLIDLGPYFRNYQETYPNSPFKRPLAFYSQKGCKWREKTKGCIFCGRMEDKWRGRNPSMIWQEITKLKKKYNIDLIVDSCDDSITSPQWFEEFYKSRLDLDLAFRIYSRADEITKEMAKKFNDLNIKLVFLGIESGDKNCLKACRKGMTLKDHIKAAQFLGDYGTQMCPSFIFGLPGENEKSIANTLKHAEKLKKYGVETAYSSTFTPLPGAIAFQRLLAIPKI